MRTSAPFLLLACAVITAVLSFLADDGFSRLSSLRKSLEHQHMTNAKLEESVQGLKRRVAGLQNDTRAIEKAARSELGMARPDEMVVIFEHKGEAKSGEGR